MRLSTRLSDKNKNFGKIESFIDWGKYTISPEEESEELQLISNGDFIEIQIGKISLPFYSTQCNDCVNFDSPLKLHCLIVNKSMVSIDCELHCTAYDKNSSLCQNCNHCVQAWFLVKADDIFASSPEINVGRVATRVKKGGHNVPEEKTRSRYERSLSNLHEAILLSDRAYIFDNSESSHKWIAEYDGATGELRYKEDEIPQWVEQYV